MFLHIGDDIMVPLREMIGIIDLTDSASSTEFLKTAEKRVLWQLTEKPASWWFVPASLSFTHLRPDAETGTAQLLKQIELRRVDSCWKRT